MATPAVSPPGGHAIGLPTGVVIGSIGRRLTAFVVDVVLVYVALGIGALTVFGGPWWVWRLVDLLCLTWLLLLWWMLATRAATVGMRLARVQLVGMHDGRPVGWLRALLRGLILGALTATVIGVIIMVILMLGHIRRQGWHDLAVDGVVIKERSLAPARVPADPTGSANVNSAASSGQLTAEADADQSASISESDAPAPADPPLRRDDPPDQPETPEPSGTVDADQANSNSVAASQPSPPPNQGWVAVVDDGREFSIQHLILVGRNPRPRPGEDNPELITISDQERTISKTHVGIDVDARGVIITDRGSTNGTAITDPDGVYRLLTAGETVHLLTPDYLVWFGNHHMRIGRR